MMREHHVPDTSGVMSWFNIIKQTEDWKYWNIWES